MTKKNFYLNIASEKANKKHKNQSKDTEYIKKLPLHRRECIKRKKRIKQEPEMQCIKTVP